MDTSKVLAYVAFRPAAMLGLDVSSDSTMESIREKKPAQTALESMPDWLRLCHQVFWNSFRAAENAADFGDAADNADAFDGLRRAEAFIQDEMAKQRTAWNENRGDHE